MEHQSLSELKVPLYKSSAELLGGIAIFSETYSSPVYAITAMTIGGAVIALGCIRGIMTLGTLE